jgi:prophage regulatory protein
VSKPPILEPNELLLRAERKKLVPLSEATIWRLERRGEFPRRIPISEKRVAWRRSEIETWLEKRAAASLPPFLQRLLEEIAAAEDAAEAAAIVQQYREELDALPARQREQATELVEDAIRERRQIDD